MYVSSVMVLSQNRYNQFLTLKQQIPQQSFTWGGRLLWGLCEAINMP